MSVAPVSSDVPLAPPATIMVVDDEPNNCELLTLLLTAQGLKVVTAADGLTALEKVSQTPPDAILLDVRMPDLDGFEVCRRLKAQSDTVFIPVVLLTALNSAKDRIHGAAAGADDFLTKPFDEVELTTRLKSLVRIKTLHDQLERQNRDLERRVAERTADLQKALTDLQELDRLKSQFISNVSHELRTPLMHAKGSIQMLADEALGALTSPQLKSVHVAQAAVGQLEDIVADVLDFGESHRRPVTLKPLDLADICQAALDGAAASAAQRQVGLELGLPADRPKIMANRRALSRILRHLLDNAVKFSPAGSTVYLGAEARPPHIRLSVQDSGCGIPHPQVDHIFEAFYQVDGATTRRANGLGIGLSVVKKLAAAHGAEVYVESRVGQGSRFYFDLYAAPAAQVDSTANPPII